MQNREHETKEDYLQFFNVCLFDYTAFAVRSKVGIP